MTPCHRRKIGALSVVIHDANPNYSARQFGAGKFVWNFVFLAPLYHSLFELQHNNKEYNERLGIKKLLTLSHRAMCWTVFAMHYIHSPAAPCIDSNRQREWSILIFAQAAKHFQSTTVIGTNKKERGKWTNLKAFLCFCVLWYFLISRRFYFSFCVCMPWILFRGFRLWYEVLYNNGKWCAFCSNLRQLLGITGMCGYILKIAENFVAMYYIKWIKVTLLPWLCARMLEQILKLVWKWTAFPLLIYFFFFFL